jgi:glyoxylase-like metal-dependent hydrolase (beta-lactamase superfamily II)
VSLVVRPSRYLHYNAGAFLSAGEACLVDPGITRDEVAALVAELGDVALRYVVLTHADWDHVLGPEHLPPTTVVAHAEFSDDLVPEEIRIALAPLEAHAGIARDLPFEPPVPDETFTDETTLAVGDLELRLAHAPGHARSMLTVYEPASATLWAADVLSDVEIPSIVDDLASYERTLAGLGQLEIRTLVPGHGTATDDRAEIAGRLDEDVAYLAALRGTVGAAVDGGRTLDEAVAAAGAIGLRRSEGDAELHRLNAEKVYVDLGGAADPAQVGYAGASKAGAAT